MIRVCIQVPEPFHSRARYALEEIASRWSIPVLFTGDTSSAQLLYAAEGGPRPSGSTLLPFDPEMYAPETRCVRRTDGKGRCLWGHADPRRRPDVVGAVYRLLTLLDESQVALIDRDRRGIFANAALPEARRAVEAEALVENLATSLLDEIGERCPHRLDAPLSRWPRDKRYALALTHDADAVHLGAPLELAHNLAKTLRRRTRQAAEMAWLGLRSFGAMSRSPFFAFDWWSRWEQARGIRSAFFVYYRPPGVRWDRDDCRSGLAGPGTDWRLLRRMADEGWEFGPHPSIHVQSTPGAFPQAREWLESRLGRPVRGLRHHFWALDWHRPYRTHREHSRAGFRYDSSIAWRDRSGFRAGTSLPYRPFDPEKNETIPLLVVPCGLMDRQVLMSSVGGPPLEEAEALRRARDFSKKVEESGGLLTLNWHQETAWNRGIYQGYLTLLEKFVDPILESSDVWVATPGEIAQHWEDLRGQILHQD